MLLLPIDLTQIMSTFSQTMLHKANVMPPVLGSQQTTLHQQQQQHNPMSMMPMAMPMPVPAPVPVASIYQQQQQQPSGQDVDLRNVIDPRLPAGAGAAMGLGRNMDQDMRGVLPHDGGAFQRNIPPPQQQLQQQLQQQQRMPAVPFQSDPRQRPVDPRVKMQQQAPPGMPTALQQPPPGMPPSVVASASGLGASGTATGSAAAAAAAAATRQSQQQLASSNANASEHEKAQLIMQVLQLSDEQIAMLPPEQRASILVLKGQIAKSTQRLP